MDKSEIVQTFLNNWNKEMEARFLYAHMASRESNPRKKSIYQKLSEIEESHAMLWAEELKPFGVTPTFTPGIRARLLTILGGLLGHTALLDSLERDEMKSVSSYAKQVGEGERRVAKKLAKILSDERGHKRLLRELSGKEDDIHNGKRWHKGTGSIRDVIFGISDGLLSTFSLVTGVAGADPQNSFVILAGLAGAIAGSTSMLSGAYISAKSEREMLEEQLETQRIEFETDPRTEEEELVLLYQLRGIPSGKAGKIAKKVMSDRSVALESMAGEELGVSIEQAGSPLKEGLVSGASFFIGALIPVLPWLLLPGKLAFYASIGASLGSFFVIGAGRTLVTGKNPWKSGLEMFLLGTASALVAYLIGSLIGVVV